MFQVFIVSDRSGGEGNEGRGSGISLSPFPTPSLPHSLPHMRFTAVKSTTTNAFPFPVSNCRNSSSELIVCTDISFCFFLFFKYNIQRIDRWLQHLQYILRLHPLPPPPPPPLLVLLLALPLQSTAMPSFAPQTKTEAWRPITNSKLMASSKFAHTELDRLFACLVPLLIDQTFINLELNTMTCTGIWRERTHSCKGGEQRRETSFIYSL